jgi:hypothetical protein
MSFIVEAICSNGPVSFLCATAADALLELEQRPHAAITIRDSGGRAIDIDE